MTTRAASDPGLSQGLRQTGLGFHNDSINILTTRNEIKKPGALEQSERYGVYIMGVNFRRNPEHAQLQERELYLYSISPFKHTLLLNTRRH